MINYVQKHLSDINLRPMKQGSLSTERSPRPLGLKTKDNGSQSSRVLIPEQHSLVEGKIMAKLILGTRAKESLLNGSRNRRLPEIV